MTPATRYSL